MARFELKTDRDPQARVRAERLKLRDRDVDEASELMQVAYARTHAMLAKAEREADELLDAARATGRAIVADAEHEAARLRAEARELLEDTRALAARAGIMRAQRLPQSERAAPSEPVDLNTATVEDLRSIGFSLTQARRVVARRDREGHYSAVEQLAELPGMPAPLLDRVRALMRV